MRVAVITLGSMGGKPGTIFATADTLAWKAAKAGLARAFHPVPGEVQFGTFEGSHQGERSSRVHWRDDGPSKRVDVRFRPYRGSAS